ncbi:MAG: glycosyltransferase [Desulfobacterales bacterium]
MKLIVYCQHVLGVGHFFRTLEICRALAGHDIVLVSGGPPTPANLPANVRRRQLPELVMDRDFQNLHSPAGRRLETVRDERRRQLQAIFREEAPDAFLVELYPIGRKAFRFELDPLLAEIDAGRLPACKVVCSVRDILVEKENAAKHESRAVDILNRQFDALLVHADPRVVRLEETFGQLAAIRIPVVYTGFVAAKAVPVPDPGAWRRSQDVADDQRLVLASAGGGAVGFDLLDAVSQAVDRLQTRYPVVLQAFTGPFMANAQAAELARRQTAIRRFNRFSEDFTTWLQVADATVSMAGYNTCMNLLTARPPALVYPFEQNREQGLRARRLAARGALQVLQGRDLEPARLAERLAGIMGQSPSPTTIDTDGAACTARWLAALIGPEGGGI